jgi:hypothetical protein
MRRFRPAVAMIELIFAIVVMGIALLSAPTLMSTAASSISVALQQEGINEASTRLNMILTYPWDQNNTDTTQCVPSVLHVSNGDSELDEVGTTERRIGVPLHSAYRTFKCATDEYNASQIGREGTTYDDLDDFADSNVSLVLESSGSGGSDYIEQSTVLIETEITYIRDDATYTAGEITYAPGSTLGSGTSNIKHIQVTLTSTNTASELQKSITLKAFSCNIGGYDYEYRTLP